MSLHEEIVQAGNICVRVVLDIQTLGKCTYIRIDRFRFKTVVVSANV